MVDPDNQIRGGGGHPDPEIRGMPGLKKRHFSALGPQFGLKIRGASSSDPSPRSATAGSGLGVR